MNLIKNFLGLFIAVTLLASCGSEPAKETVEPKAEEIVGKKVEEFDVRAIGNTMAEMKYDIENITVKEGVKIKINLINEGIDQAMLHNILFVNFGKRKDVAAAAVKAGNDKAFVPDHPELIAASSLAKPGETVTFEFDAPKKGNYEYFCSYPGHSQIMRGYLFVK